MTFPKQYCLIFIPLMGMLLLVACSHPTRKSQAKSRYQIKPSILTQDPLPFVCIIDTPVCDEHACKGTYRGVEFVAEQYQERLHLNGTDVAHQYSNKMCEYVGKQLKQLYLEGKYSKVDFRHIRMSTKGMGDGDDYVEVELFIPFKRVAKSKAMTAFDHSGGWGHQPEIIKRKFDLLHSKSHIVKNNRLFISKLFKTKEGLQEYWIQWQHRDFQ